ncbi:MAG: TonB-dependent outer rane transport protein [Gemmatimonadetes bacterium]|nr:TonB-dependent outer rane transport protein [Gemmatimonadota bacterium]
MPCCSSSAPVRRVWTFALATSAIVSIAPGIRAQTPTTTHTDSARADSLRARALERVMISAVRASGAAPISQKTLTQAELAPRYFGQDVPLLLQGAAPSLTSYAETGNYWGYSYIRLRGIDQSRINLTLDGIPLNDPEDQVLYFADFPDLANSLSSVQVQRGVGTSSNGTAAFAGSINMESAPLGASQRGGTLQLEGGSFGSKRVSGEFDTGLLPSRFALSARVSALRTEGYRYHSGVEGRSLFVSGGYFGDRDIVKATVTTGTMRDTMAYLAVSAADLALDRRINPLTPRERDGFGERLAALAYTRLLGPSTSISTTVYRISASGDYDVAMDTAGTLDNFNLKFVWYGATSDWSYRHDAVQLDVGVNANTYARDHAAYERPAIADPLYFNTGHKQDASAFAKLAYTAGRATLFGDLQARRAEFRYSPDVHAGIGEQSIAWSFLNPKAGVTYALTAPLSLYASYGKNTREPARNDMFAGFDNLDTSNVAFVGGLNRVKPETVHDLEAGATYRGARLDAQANVYSMDFRNEIAPIGQLSYLGSPLRKNVAASYRRGVEFDVTYRAHPRLLLAANAAASVNRIRQYVDSTGDAPVTYDNVEPLLTPRFVTFERAQFAATRDVSLSVETRYQSRSFLQNTSDPRFILPASLNLDGTVSWRVRRYELVVRGNNLTNSKKFGSGYASGGVSYYFVLPPRNVFVTAKVGF